MTRIHVASTPNGRKALIGLEELGIDYEVVRVDLGAGAQHDASFRKLNPNGKIPVLEDGGQVVWESGAILLYLGETHDPEHRLLPRLVDRRWQAIQYTFFQTGGLGPALGRLSTQLQRPASDRNAEMTEVFATEVDRLIGVLDRILADGRNYLAYDYSIGDVMHYPWLQPVLALGTPQLTSRPRVVEWLERVARRPAVGRAYEIA